MVQTYEGSEGEGGNNVNILWTYEIKKVVKRSH